MKPRLVVLSEHSLSYVTRKDFEVSAPSATAAEWGRGLGATLQILNQAGIPVAVIADTPLMASGVPNCLGRAARPISAKEGSCGRDRDLALDAKVSKVESAVVKTYPQSFYIDMSDFICGKDTCGARDSALVYYRDANHISEPLARSLQASLGEALSPVWIASDRATKDRERYNDN